MSNSGKGKSDCGRTICAANSFGAFVGELNAVREGLPLWMEAKESSLCELSGRTHNLGRGCKIHDLERRCIAFPRCLISYLQNRTG